MAFKYQRRSEADLDRRANQKAGNYEGYVQDEFVTYAAKKGDNYVRILPPTWEDATHYGYDIYVHFQVGPDNGSVLCLSKMKNKPCPLCDARARAEKTGDEELAGKLKPTRRVAVWMLDMNEEKKGPMIWGMPWTLDRDIAKISKDKRSGQIFEIDDPDNGYNVSFEKEGDQRQTKYTGVQIDRKPSSVDEAWLEFIDDHPLPETLRFRTYEEVQELYEGSGAADERPARRRRDNDEDEALRRREEDLKEERPRRARDAEEEEKEEKRPERLRRRSEDEAEEKPAPRRAAREDKDEKEERAPRRANGNGHAEKEEEEEKPRKSRDADEEDAPRRGAVSGASRADELRQRYAKG